MTALFIGVLFSVAIFGMSYYILDVLNGRAAQERNVFQARIRSLEPGYKSDIKIEKNKTYSEIKALNELLKEQEFTQKLSRMFTIAGWKFSIGFFILLSTVIAACFYLLLTYKGVSAPIALIISVGCLFFIPMLILKIKYNAYIAKFTNHFTKALQVIRGALTAGLGLGVSFDRAAQDAPYPVNVEFSHVLEEVNLGKSLTEALVGLHKRVPTLDVKTFVVAITVQQESGGNLVEVMKNLEDTINARILLRNEMNALTAQARLSGWIITALPPLIGMAIKAMNPAYFSMFNSEDGHKLIGVTIGMMFFGFLCIRAITNIKIKT